MSDEALIEAAVGAFRERVLGEIRPSPEWADLDDVGRRTVYDQTVTARALEAAADPAGLSTTAHAVLARIRGA